MLAQGDKFTVTPTFHVFQMYLPHSGAQAVRSEFSAPSIRNPLADTPIPVGGNSYRGSLDAVKTLAGLSGSASLAKSGNGKQITLTVVNPHLDQALMTEVVVQGAAIASATGTVLSETDIHAHNDFEHPNAVHPRPATVGQATGGRLLHTFPAASVTTLNITLALRVRWEAAAVLAIQIEVDRNGGCNFDWLAVEGIGFVAPFVDRVLGCAAKARVALHDLQALHRAIF